MRKTDRRRFCFCTHKAVLDSSFFFPLFYECPRNDCVSVGVEIAHGLCWDGEKKRGGGGGGLGGGRVSEGKKKGGRDKMASDGVDFWGAKGRNDVSAAAPPPFCLPKVESDDGKRTDEAHKPKGAEERNHVALQKGPKVGGRDGARLE